MSKITLRWCAYAVLWLSALRSGAAHSQHAPYSNVPSERQGDIEECHVDSLPDEAYTTPALKPGWVKFCEYWQALVRDEVITPMRAKWGSMYLPDSVSSHGASSYSQQTMRFYYNRQFALCRDHHIEWGSGTADVSPIEYGRQYLQRFANDMQATAASLNGHVPDFPKGSKMTCVRWRWHFQFPP